MSRRPPTDNLPGGARRSLVRARRRLLWLAGLLAGVQVVVLAGTVLAVAGAGLHGTAGADAGAPGELAGADVCAPAPSWLSGGEPAVSAHDPLSACFAHSSPAEAPLALANNGSWPLLIAVSGPVGLDEYWFSGRVDAALASSLRPVGSGADEQVIVLGPHRRATLKIGRPPPASASQEIRVVPSHGVGATLGGLAWTFLRDLRQRGPVPAAVERCVASPLVRAASSVGPSRHTLALMRLCVLGAAAHAGHATGRIRALAGSLLSGRAFDRAAEAARGVALASAIDLAIAGSAPSPVNPEIHIAAPDLGSVYDGTRTVAHLSATGGVAPYRFYIWQEPGGPSVPSWVRLTPAGILTIAPPEGASQHVELTIYAIDANGYLSQDVPY